MAEKTKIHLKLLKRHYNINQKTINPKFLKILKEKVPNTKWTLDDFEIGPCLGQVLSKTQKQVEREIAIQ
ncbi:unnamed protein product [Rhizopus stolonifer]